jgi:hypothetical protein
MTAMKTLRQILFTIVAVIGLSMAVSAQKDDQKRPPKEKPPVIKPEPKNPPRENPPKGGDKPKKPGMSFFLATKRTDSYTA